MLGMPSARRFLPVPQLTESAGRSCRPTNVAGYVCSIYVGASRPCGFESEVVHPCDPNFLLAAPYLFASKLMALSFLFCKSRFNVGRDLCAGVPDEAAYAPERDYPSVHGVLAKLARIDLAEGEGHWDIEAGSPKREENVRSSIESGNAAPPEGPAGRTRTSNLATCR